MPENYLDVLIARTYEAEWPEIFDPAAIDPAVSFLAGLAGSGAALELGIGSLRERWSDWQRAPFIGDSRSHISVGQKGP